MPVAEVVLVEVTAQVSEGKDGDEGLVGHDWATFSRSGKHLTDFDSVARTGSEMFFSCCAPIPASEVDGACRRMPYPKRRCRQAPRSLPIVRLRRCRHRDTGFVEDDVPLVYADPELRASRWCDGRVTLDHRLLDRDGAFDRV